MKIQIATLTIVSSVFSSTFHLSNAFTVPSSLSTSTSTSTSTTTTCLHMKPNNRRQAITTLLSGIITTSTTTSIITSQPQPAFAKREPLPEYLTEPTEEFKESERQRDEFRRKQLVIKRKFNTVLDRLTFESKTEEDLVNDLKELRYLVIETEGLPLGIKKEEMIKIIRAKKAKGFWPTNVEIAYQKLTGEIAYQQSPNREKDTANPL